MAKGKGGFIGQDGLNAPDAPTGVSGTAGDTQVTVSWTAPSDVGGSAITGYNVQGSNGAALTLLGVYSGLYANKSFSIASQETSPKGVFFKSDGSKMYVTGQTSDYTYQYSLSTAWDVSTASYDSVSLANPATSVTDIFFKPDGTELYFAESTNQTNIYRYTLSTAWDLSTATSTNSNTSSFTELGNNQMIFFKSDGTKLYLGHNQNLATDLYEYDLSTAWDITTSSVSYSGNTLETTAQDNEIGGIFFNSDGTEFYLLGYQNDRVYIYTLSTAWDISSGAYTGYYISVGTQETQPEAVTFSPDLKNMYVVGFTNDTVYQYDVSPESYPTASPVTITGLTNGTSYTFNVWAINAFGWSSPSDASGSVSPAQPRALFAGGLVYPADTYTNIIDYVAISTLGNASDFGDLAAATDAVAGAANATRGLFAGGYVSSIQNTIQYVTIASTGNTQDFGDLTVSRSYFTSGANTTRAIWFGGNDSGYSNTIDYVTIATAGNAADFGDMTNFIQAQQNGTCSSPTRSLSAGGFQFSKSPPQINRIDYVTTATLGNATDFGDLLEETAQGGACASSTRGLFSGGNSSSGSIINTIQYVTLASTGNASDFGDLHATIEKTTSASSETRGLVSAGGDSTASSGGNLNNINYVTIATTGNSSDFGDLTSQFDNHSGLSNAHGGLQ